VPGAQLEYPLLVQSLEHIATAEREGVLQPPGYDEFAERA
jgi:hypothetical protein